MPRTRNFHVCPDADCGELVPQGTRRCPKHERSYGAAAKQRSSEWNWVYQSPRWRGLRRQVRREQPFCLCGCNTVWTDLDHVVGMAEGGEPFARENVEGRCKRSHSAKTATETFPRGRDRVP